MAYQSLSLGTTANDGTGDTLRAGGDKINDNFVEIYTLLGTGSALTSGLSASSSVVTLTSGVLTTCSVATSLDMNGTELILDADADTSIHASTDDQIDIKIAGADDFAFTANKFDILSGSTLEVNGTLDMNGSELILDADADTSITADSDDTINFKIGGNDRIDLSTGLVSIKNDGAKSQVRLYCESSNAHYVAIESPAHAVYSGNITVTLPNKTSTIQGSSTENITGAGALDDDVEVSTLALSGSGAVTLPAGRFAGQRKIIIMTTDNGDVTMTQSGGNLNSTNVSTSIVWNDVGDNVLLVYNGSNWNVVSSQGVSIS